MTSLGSFVTAAVAVSVLACSHRPTYTPVRAEREGDIAALVGDWEGEYTSPVTGRSGAIVFKLRPGDRMAEGSVTMLPAGFGGSITQPHRLPPAGDRAGSYGRELTIAFCRVRGRQVIGEGLAGERSGKWRVHRVAPAP